MTKRITALFLSIMLLTATPCFAAESYQDGIYQDLAPGFGDEVIVTLTVRGGKIVALDAKNRNGGESDYFWQARDGMATAIIETQGIDGVDAISGATGTSESILAAMKGLLLQLRYTGPGVP